VCEISLAPHFSEVVYLVNYLPLTVSNGFAPVSR
jgi:hypothetical protein